MLLTAFLVALPIAMIGWGTSLFVIRLRRQRRRARLLPSQRIDVAALIGESAGPAPTASPAGHAEIVECAAIWPHCSRGCITACDHNAPCLAHATGP